MLVVDHIEVGEVEISFRELSHELDATEVIREVDPAAFLVEDGGLQLTWRKVPGDSG